MGIGDVDQLTGLNSPAGFNLNLRDRIQFIDVRRRRQVRGYDNEQVIDL